MVAMLLRSRQDAHHFWLECEFSHSTRPAVLSRALHVLRIRHCDVSFWESMPPVQRHLHLLGASTMFDEGTALQVGEGRGCHGDDIVMAMET